mmetsp:Transcript_45403/g.128116  ORF Transcript_45403/g.128116 Transcript_45403/m.128116 type:complete len:212 (+) Transcript_45403:2692-3327(+)
MQLYVFEVLHGQSPVLADLERVARGEEPVGGCVMGQQWRHLLEQRRRQVPRQMVTLPLLLRQCVAAETTGSQDDAVRVNGEGRGGRAVVGSGVGGLDDHPFCGMAGQVRRWGEGWLGIVGYNDVQQPVALHHRDAIAEVFDFPDQCADSGPADRHGTTIGERRDAVRTRRTVSAEPLHLGEVDAQRYEPLDGRRAAVCQPGHELLVGHALT